MKERIILIALFCLCYMSVSGQKKYEMVIEKTDGTEIVVNTEDIVRTYFRERNGGSNSSSNYGIVGTWCYGDSEEDALGNQNNIEGYIFRADGTCVYFGVYNNGQSKEKREGTYSFTGNTLTIVQMAAYEWKNNAWSPLSWFSGKTRTYNVSISGNCMTWTGDDNETLYTREGFTIDLGQ